MYTRSGWKTKALNVKNSEKEETVEKTPGTVAGHASYHNMQNPRGLQLRPAY